MGIVCKRIYDPATPEDGARVLVDHYWPRGMSKERAALAAWMKTIAPSPQLIAEFGHREGRWEEFRQQYFEELAQPEHEDDLRQLQQWAREGRLTLLYAARDTQHNNAVALAQYLHGTRLDAG